jgi:hypothetical protein
LQRNTSFDAAASDSLSAHRWRGTAPELAEEDFLGVYLVNGLVEAQEISWTLRFGLQFDLTITLPEQEIDLYTAIATQIESAITVEIPT